MARLALRYAKRFGRFQRDPRLFQCGEMQGRDGGAEGTREAQLFNDLSHAATPPPRANRSVRLAKVIKRGKSEFLPDARFCRDYRSRSRSLCHRHRVGEERESLYEVISLAQTKRTSARDTRFFYVIHASFPAAYIRGTRALSSRPVSTGQDFSADLNHYAILRIYDIGPR